MIFRVSLVEAVRVESKDVGELHRERRVDVHRHVGKSPLIVELLEGVDHFLRPLERERGDDDLAATLRRCV